MLRFSFVLLVFIFNFVLIVSFFMLFFFFDNSTSNIALWGCRIVTAGAIGLEGSLLAILRWILKTLNPKYPKPWESWCYSILRVMQDC